MVVINEDGQDDEELNKNQKAFYKEPLISKADFTTASSYNKLNKKIKGIEKKSNSFFIVASDKLNTFIDEQV